MWRKGVRWIRVGDRNDEEADAVIDDCEQQQEVDGGVANPEDAKRRNPSERNISGRRDAPADRVVTEPICVTEHAASVKERERGHINNDGPNDTADGGRKHIDCRACGRIQRASRLERLANLLCSETEEETHHEVIHDEVRRDIVVTDAQAEESRGPHVIDGLAARHAAMVAACVTGVVVAGAEHTLVGNPVGVSESQREKDPRQQRDRKLLQHLHHALDGKAPFQRVHLSLMPFLCL
mmetsp:Transcript_77408/g.215157  ORF Transcript_77408/g.215157 Transcript_77408/m.215157 type:complete len:238 (-) Transcript_77408:1134-1847(-)